MDSLLAETLHWITRGIEVAGVLVILAGLVTGTIGYLTGPRGEDAEEKFRLVRTRLGRSIQIGLEFLMAADIVNTVAAEQSLHSLAVLAGIVAIRTFLRMSLEVEIEGCWPWHRHRHEDRRGEPERSRPESGGHGAAEDGPRPAEDGPRLRRGAQN